MVEFRETSGKAAAPASTGQRLVAFGDVRFDVRSGEVWHAERAVQLTPRAASVLALLIERAPQLVTKQEMVDRVWDGRIIGDEALTSCVQELRRALADNARQPRYIETRHRRGYRLIPSVTALAADSSPTPPEKPSIAVLPFQNMSGDPEQEYFADGIVEDIITALSRFASLFVIARNSSFTYKGQSPDIRQVGRELGVRYVLEGSVRKAGGQVRITGQLVDCETGAHLWADSFDGALDQVFQLQDEVTARVVSAVAPKIDQVEIDRARKRPIANLDAYDCMLQGLHSFYISTRDSVEAARLLYYRAIDLDPGFATPYAMAIRCYMNRKLEGWTVEGEREWERAETRRLALQVQLLGRDNALALCWAGARLHYVCREDDSGAAMIDQALAVNGNLAVAWRNRGALSQSLGRHEASIEQLTRAMRLSPIDPQTFMVKVYMAQALVCLGRYDDALKLGTSALGHRSDSKMARRVIAIANALAGHDTEARRVMAELRQLEPWLTVTIYAKDVSNFRRPQDLERFAEGLRLAGLPE